MTIVELFVQKLALTTKLRRYTAWKRRKNQQKNKAWRRIYREDILAMAMILSLVCLLANKHTAHSIPRTAHRTLRTARRAPHVTDLSTVVQSSLVLKHQKSHFPTGLAVSHEQCEQWVMSNASERVNGQASGPVLTPRLAVLCWSNPPCIDPCLLLGYRKLSCQCFCHDELLPFSLSPL